MMLLPELSEELIKRYLQGDRDACRELLKRPQYYQLCQKIAKKIFSRKPLDCEDAAQSAFEKVLKEALSGKFKKGNSQQFYHWCAKVALNYILDLLRKTKKETELIQAQLQEKVLDEYIDIREDLELLDTNSQIQKAIISIDQQYPKKKYLYIWQGLVNNKKQTEIAKILGFKQSEVSKRHQELAVFVGKELGYLNVKQAEEMLKQIRQGRRPKRSQEDWEN